MGENRWYVAVLVVECTVDGNEGGEPLVDLQHRLVLAADAEDAYRKALDLGQQSNHSYDNGEGGLVRWKFEGLFDLQVIQDDELAHGTEVFSLLRRARATDYVVEKNDLTEF